MTPLHTRTVLRGRRNRVTKNSEQARGAARAAGARRPGAPKREATPMWTLLLPSYCQINHPRTTEEAMPDPDAGPSQRTGAHTLGGTA